MASVAKSLIVVLAAIASLVGLLRPDVYRDPEIIREAWRPNDAITLLVAVPLLYWTAQRGGSMRARLVELGILHYLLYDYAFYLFGAELNALFLVYAALVAGTFWTLVLSLRELDLARVPRLRAGGVVAWMLLVAFGLTATWTAQWFAALARTTAAARFDLTPAFVRTVGAIDLTMMVGLLVPGALLLRRRNAWGTVIGAALGVSGALYDAVLAGGAMVQIRAGLAGAWPMLLLWCALAIGSGVAAFRLVRRADCFSNPLMLGEEVSHG